MSNPSHLETPEFPLRSTGDVDGPAFRQAHEIGCGAVILRATNEGHQVCLKLDRIGKEYTHHYVIALDTQSQDTMRLMYVDPEEMLFDCFATLDIRMGAAVEGAPEVGHAFENKSGHFIKAFDDPNSRTMFGFIHPASGLVRLRQDRKVTMTYPHWQARAKLHSQDDLVELSALVERFSIRL